MAKNTGFDKFVAKQFEDEGVKIAAPAAPAGHRMTREERIALARSEGPVRKQEPEERVEEQGVAPAGSPLPEAQSPEVVEAVSEPQRGRGRPALDPELKQKLVPLHFAVDIEVKRKLEQLKINLYRSSVKDLLMEAIRDLLVKYDMD